MSSSPVPTAISENPVLRRVPERTTEAWARQDADAFASVFTPDTNIVIAGTYLVGREAVRGYMAAALGGPLRGSRVVSDPVYLELLGPDIALLVTEGGVLLPGEDVVAPQRSVRGTWVLVNAGDEWQIRAYHSSPIPEAS